MSLNIAGVPIGSGHPCRFVAELSNNHNGDLARAKRLIVAAKNAGADFVKFQCYTPDELVALRGDGPAPEPWGSQGWTMRSLYEKAQTPHDWFPHLAGFCESLGIPWFSSAFGEESLALLERLGCPALKLARLDNKSSFSNHVFHWARRNRKPLIVSADYDRTTKRPAYAGERNAQAVLYCSPGYPQKRFDLSCLLFSAHSHRDRIIQYAPFDGFSYHGTDPLPCVAAATLGAKIIEAHFQLDDELSELEANVSLTENAFRWMVDDVRRVEKMLA